MADVCSVAHIQVKQIRLCVASTRRSFEIKHFWRALDTFILSEDHRLQVNEPGDYMIFQFSTKLQFVLVSETFVLPQRF